MMFLRVVERGVWTVFAVSDQRGHCPLQEFIDRLRIVNQAEFRRAIALLGMTAANGPPRNEAKSRRLAKGIYELKTRGGIRIPYFVDEGRVIICTEAIMKPKGTELRKIIRRSELMRESYFRAKSAGALEIIRKD